MGEKPQYAFPFTTLSIYHPGMTLRDYFAGQALAGSCADPSVGHSADGEDVAAYCYGMADAMLKVRKEKEKEADDE